MQTYYIGIFLLFIFSWAGYIQWSTRPGSDAWTDDVLRARQKTPPPTSWTWGPWKDYGDPNKTLYAEIEAEGYVIAVSEEQVGPYDAHILFSSTPRTAGERTTFRYLRGQGGTYTAQTIGQPGGRYYKQIHLQMGADQTHPEFLASPDFQAIREAYRQNRKIKIRGYAMQFLSKPQKFRPNGWERNYLCPSVCSLEAELL